MSIGWTGVAAGAGIALLGNAIIPAVGSGLKMVTKNLIKGSLLTYQGGKAFVDKTTKSIETLTSEAKSELNGGSGKQGTAKKAVSKSEEKKKTTPSATA